MNQTFSVSGMTCGHCEKAVIRAIQQCDPQADVRIDREQCRIDREQCRVDVVSQQPRDELAKAIKASGYTVAGA